MGNCLPFFSFISRNEDDLTTLNNLSEERSHSGQMSRQSFYSDSNRTRSSRRRSQQPVIIYIFYLFINIFIKIKKA